MMGKMETERVLASKAQKFMLQEEFDIFELDEKIFFSRFYTLNIELQPGVD